MKIALGMLAVALLGFGLGRLTATPVVSAPPVDHQVWAEQGIRKLAETDDPALKLAEAEKYYGKAVVLFLAGLAREAQPEAAEVIPESDSDATPEQRSSEPAAAVQEKPALETVSTRTMTKKERLAAEAAKKKDTALNRMVAFQRSVPYDKLTPEVRKMLGVFEGSLTQLEGKNKGRVDHVFMEFGFTMQEGRLSGAMVIKLIDPQGNVYSNSRGDGGNNTLRPVAGQSDQIYVQTAPGEFIILDLKNPNQLRGSYYDSTGAYVGAVEVWRQ